MTVLIHLNGPSGVGKSTLAERYVGDHLGVLDLDTDRIVCLVGGWQDDFGAALAPARRIALAGAEAHLASGHDVVVPQLVTDAGEARRFEEAAHRSGADYLEVALTVTPAEQLRRFYGKHRVLDVDVHVGRYIEDRGGAALLRRIHGHVAAYLDQRPAARRVVTDGLDPDAAYDALLLALH